MPSSVSFRYARALSDLVDTAEGHQVVTQLTAFVSALETSGDLRNAIQSPAVTPQGKQAVVKGLSSMLGLSDLVQRFLFVVIDHRRTAMLADIGEAFEQIMDERIGVVRADVSSARELDEGEQAQLTASLGYLTGKQVRPRFRVEPHLIGGAMARIGSTVYDGSVKGQLEALKERLAGAER
ncbi:MAG TPA: ATP synthase F1 subunit delta [Bryobacteraceae bacterium]|nr:ATP synthase F1 subunit delta [Bryobacteraceae bacterium]